MRNDFAVFILTYGRADNVVTLKSLKKSGYTGKVYFLVSDDDSQQDRYIKNFGKENVFIFNKDDVGKRYDLGDNFTDRKKVIFYARNYNFEIAKKLKLKYFLQLDDDYTQFDFIFDSKNEYKRKQVKNIDKVIDVFIEFLEATKAKSVAFVQGGDLLGGKNSDIISDVKMKRKAMNTFFCSVDNSFNFVGRINEDVNTYVLGGTRGDLFLTCPQVAIVHTSTQTNKNGMTETYLDGGTYLKSFYSVMYAPSCVKIGIMGEAHKRIHHSINWNNCTPCIIDEGLKK